MAELLLTVLRLLGLLGRVLVLPAKLLDAIVGSLLAPVFLGGILAEGRAWIPSKRY